ncbi:MAG: hypothetical protein WBD28_12490, partial [Candidatus Zixiibacteriota bacterium]
MKTFKVLSILALTLVAFILVFRPFNGQVIGFPSEGEQYDPYFEAANAWFDSVATVHTQEIPILDKIESKLYYIAKGLKSEKDGKWLAFDTLEKKLDNIVGLSDSGLPPEAVIDFINANDYFTNVTLIHSWKGDLPGAVKDYFLKSNSYFDTVRLIHNDTLFADSSELWRIEQKLWSFNQALKNEKHAKKGAFYDLEAKLDTLLGREYAIPESIDACFDTADIYFDSVDVVHEQVGGLTGETDQLFELANIWFDSLNLIHEHEPPIYPEWQNIEWKIYYLNNGLQLQKEGKHLAFIELEAKLDTLLGWEFMGLNPDVEGFFLGANDYFDNVNIIHKQPMGPELLNIEWKLHYLKTALHNQKHAKWIMFDDLDKKLDLLLNQPNDGLPPEVNTLFNNADYYLDSINYIHEQALFPDSSEEWKIMQKLHYLKYGLKNQKDAMWLMFVELEYKLDILVGPRVDPPGLPKEVDSLFISSNEWFDSVNFIYSQIEMPIPMRVEWMLHYLKHAVKDEKDAKWMAFDELKRKAYEFDKVEQKLYYLGKALKYQKDAKRLMFAELGWKLDSLLGVPLEGLPPHAELDFQMANVSFDLVDTTHNKSEVPELEKIKIKITYLRDGLMFQRYAVEKMFDTLNVKINLYVQMPDDGLDPEIVADFDSATNYFALIDEVEQMPGLIELQKIELMIYYLSQGQQFVKQAQEKMFTQWKEKLFEFDKIEKKLYNINQASQFAKDAKELIFEHLEEKLDTLFERRGWDPIVFPALVTEHFGIANSYFELVNSLHLEPAPDTTEMKKIGLKIHYLKHALWHQRLATWLMFANLEEKLDSLLYKEYLGLPELVDLYFDSAGFYFDSVNVIYGQFGGNAGELDKIEEMLDAFTIALKFAKDAKWLMFDELEDKIDSLPETGVREVGEKETVPEKFVLMQNYPNPFNPVTNIEFSIPEPAWVKVEIYNVLGEKIVTLVDEKLSAGYKIVEWDGKDNQGIEVSTGI